MKTLSTLPPWSQHTRARFVLTLIISLLLLLALSKPTYATNYTFNVTSGNWSSSTSWWPIGVPTFTDNVTIPAGRTVIIDENSACQNLVGTGGTINGASHITLFIYGEFNLNAASTWNFAGKTRFEAENSSHNITSGGATFTGPVYFDGVGGKWQLQDDFVCTNTTYLVNGRLNLGGVPMTTARFDTDNDNARTLDMQGSAMFITGSYLNHNFNRYSWDAQDGTNLQVINSSAGGSGIYFTGTGDDVGFASNGVDYPGAGSVGSLEIIFQCPLAHIIGSNNFFNSMAFAFNGRFWPNQTNIYENLTFSQSHYRFDKNCTVQVANLNAMGTCDGQVTFMSPNNITSAEPLIEFIGGGPVANMDHVVINGVNGVNVPGAGINILYQLKGTGWPVSTTISGTYIWQNWLGTNNWGDPGNWEWAPGGIPSGSSNGCIPNPQTPVYFPAASFPLASNSVIVNITNANCHDMVWDPAIVNPTNFISSSTTNRIAIHGSLSIPVSSTVFWVFNGVTHFSNTPGSYAIDAPSQNFPGDVYFDAPWSTTNWTHISDFNCTEDLFVLSGNWDANENDINVLRFNSEIDNVRSIDISSASASPSTTVTCAHSWDIYDHGSTTGADPYMTLSTNNSTIQINTYNFQSQHDYGNTYYNLRFTHADTKQQSLFGEDNVFLGDVFFAGNGQIFEYNEYHGNLEFSAGKAYTIGGTQTLTNTGNLLALGLCDGYIYMKGGEFNKATGSGQTVEYCIIKDNVASGGVSFNGNNSFAYGNIGLWNVTPPPAPDLFFKATTSNRWNDAGNWYIDAACTTPPTPACPPNPLTDVYFVPATWTTAQPDFIEIDISNAYCHSMYWTSGYGSPATLGDIRKANTVTNTELHVFGDFILANSSVMDWDLDGYVRFEGSKYGYSGPFVYNTNAYNQTLNQEAIFECPTLPTPETVWNFQGAFATDYGRYGITLTRGTVNTLGNSIDAGHFHSYGNATRALDADASQITLKVETVSEHSWAWRTNTSFVYSKALGNLISLDNTTTGGEVWMSASSTNFEDVTFEADAHAFLQGDNSKTFNNLEFLGNGEIQCGNTINGTLTLSPSYIYHFEAGETQTLSSSVPVPLSATGSAGLVVYIRSSEIGLGNNATFDCNNTNDICIDYASLRDNDATGTTRFYDGPDGYNVSENSGWAFTNCGAVQSLTGCAGQPIAFSTSVSGTSYEWDFGNTFSTTTTTSSTNYTYTITGTYNAKVTINTGGSQDIRYFTVTVNNNCCTATIVSVQNVDCFGNASGCATALAGGGLSPYTYAWPSSGTAATECGLAAGSYTVTITGSAGCTATATANITQPAILTATVSPTTVGVCPPATATATATPSGGTAPYTYSWTGGSTTNPGTGLAVGTNTVTVTDANGCTTTASMTVTSLFQGFPFQGIGASGTNTEMASISVDDNGSYYVTGSFETSITLPNPGGTPVTLTSFGGRDIYIAKYSNCQLDWARNLGDAGDDEGTGIVVSQGLAAPQLFVCGNIEPFSGVNSFDAASSYSIPVINLPWASISGFVANIDPATGHTVRVTAFSENQQSDTRATGVHMNRMIGHEYVHVSGQFNHIISSASEPNVSTMDWSVLSNMDFDAALFTVIINTGQFDHITPVGGIGNDIAEAVKVDPLATSVPQYADYVFFTGQVHEYTGQPAMMLPPQPVFDRHGADGRNAFVARCYVSVYAATSQQRLLTLGSQFSGAIQSGMDLAAHGPERVSVGFEHDGAFDFSAGYYGGGTVYMPSTGTNDIAVAHFEFPLSGGGTPPVTTTWYKTPSNFHVSSTEYFGGMEYAGTELRGVYNVIDAGSTDLYSFNIDLASTGTPFIPTSGPVSQSALITTPAIVESMDVDCELQGGSNVYISGFFTDDISVSSTLVNATGGDDGFAAKLDIGSNTYVAKQGLASRPVEETPSVVSLFPNPTSGQISLEFPEEVSGTITVLDAYGQLLIKEEFVSSTSGVIDLSVFANGVYLIHIDAVDIVETHQVIKSN